MPSEADPRVESDDFLPWLEQRQAQRRSAGKKNRLRAVAVTLGLVALVVLSAVVNPPTATVHGFSKVSDYNATRQSGCTNSGNGCHGAEKDYADFNAYHPEAKCTTCHDYQGIGCIPCHKPLVSECELCHDGTMKGAADVVRITDSYPKGHYRETSHTADVGDLERVVRASASGKAKASCADCHSGDLRRAHTSVKPAKGSKYGDTLKCVECHNDTATDAVEQVTSKWRSRKCEACHAASSPVPMHETTVAPSVAATGPAGCGTTGAGCHAVNDLHALHADKPASCAGTATAGEPGCHVRGVEAQVPATTACGAGVDGCHPRYLDDDFGHDRDREVHSPGTAVARDTSYHGIACGACHHMEDDGRSLQVEHALATSARTIAADSACRDCHNHRASQDALDDEWPARETVYACGDCHGRNGLERDHAADLKPLHASVSEGCASTGPGCHPTADLSEVGTPTLAANIHTTCLRCHDRTASGLNGSYDPEKKTCGSGRDCHGGFDVATAVHRGRGGVIDGADAKHAAGDAQDRATMTDPKTGITVRCDACHVGALGTEHARPNSSIANGGDTVCERCHDATPVTAGVVKDGWDARGGDEACAACHGTPDVPAPHAAIDTVHTDTTLDADGSVDESACVSAGCHTTTDVRVLHAALGCTVAGCHTTSGDIAGRDLRSCGGTDPRTGCHTGYARGDGHETTFPTHQGDELDELGDVVPGTCARVGCHTSVDLRRLHRSAGCGIDGCHETGTTPSITGCGGPDPEIGCHNGFTAQEHFVDHSADLTGTVDGITYRTGANVGCFGCHPSDLRAIHATGTAGPFITGGGASNCRVCHYDPDDPGSGTYAKLPAVTNAVATKDRRCGSCHASGSVSNGPTAASSAHKRISPAFPPPAGYVSTDPAAEWRAAFDSPMGGGHNVLPADLVGADAGRDFPATSFGTFAWSLPPNTGATTWLRTSVFPAAETTAAIRSITVTCQDCHVIPSGMAGPHGSAVPVSIDPAYSQTEYAQPTRGTSSQFAATGAERVVCFKCHNLQVGSVPGTDSPGGAAVHAQHAAHADFPDYNPVRYGEKCVDCHVRIPHAWRHARLLVRTVTNGDGVPADSQPYVAADHDGLLGVLRQDIDGAAGPPASACVTGGCHGRHDATTHPMPKDVPGSDYWP